MYRKLAALSIVVVIGLTATACAKTVAEKIIEKQTGGKVKIGTGKNSGSVEIKGKDGTVRIGENKVPADFPKDVPIYKGAQVKGSMSSTANGKKTFIVTLTTDDALKDAADYYKKELTSGGWTEKSAMTGGERGSQFAALGYEKGETLVTVSMTRVDSDKQTQMAISVAPKP